MSAFDHKLLKVRVNLFDNHHFVWNLQGYIRREGSDEVEIECFLNDADAQDMTAGLLGVPASAPFAPRTPPCPVSPPLTFKAIVNDTTSWSNSTASTIRFQTPECPPELHLPPPVRALPPPRLIASPEPEEEPIEHNPRKRGRPRGSKNRVRGDEAWRKSFKVGPKECSARTLLDNIANNLECKCCCNNSQLLVKCSTSECDANLCMECIKTVEKRFEGKCPYCRQQF